MSSLPLDDLTVAVARIRGLLLSQEKADRAVSLLAQAIKQAMPGATGTGASLLDPAGGLVSSGSTDAVVRQADTAQYELGEGPCLTAWAAEEVVIIQDVHTEGRWPRWTSAVAGLPVRSVVSAPLLAGKEAIGALKIYSALPGQYDDDAGSTLALFAGTAATLLAHIQGSEAPLRMSEELKATLASRDTINRACGVLMERHGISHDQALQQMINNARAAGAPLVKISEKLVTKVPPAEG
ncbi:GAF and ANTAR domain-containing protein [Arthrobacter sp. BB-1]|uniref:GAF and ANTAR domain-containing protein n=1 Tax=Micrococcaceae TaxID=1268 RepID=UPI001111B955|nr:MULTISPECIES: GAF and ANTAR domain-containing protein [Micrococcaceae]TNB70281.1 GAF and ANTAR domain-containing protein [Arthrobacter sp. BB-1]UEL27834.1 GAF and ANTAR domain-containing protein [Pseudarthrobacter sp. L1SW]